MKKKLAVLLVLASLTVAGVSAAAVESAPDTAAVAPQAQSMGNPRWAALAQDPAMREKIQKFYKDTSSLRKQIVMKRAELAAVIHAAQADPATAGKMAGELYDLRASLRKQAEAAGLNQFWPGCGMGRGMGGGRGMVGGFGR